MCRLLAGHPNLQLAGVHANSSAGRRLGELQPHLLPFAEMVVQPRAHRPIVHLGTPKPAMSVHAYACMVMHREYRADVDGRGHRRHRVRGG